MIPASGRVLGLDLGTVRIGVAISDTHQRLASSLQVVARSADPGAHRRALALVVALEEAVGVVVGLPLSLDGSVGPAARTVLDEVRAWAPTVGPVPIETIDERFTTVAAHQARRAGGGRGKKTRQGVDAVAAALLLQSWLDRRRASGSRSSGSVAP